MTDEEPSPDEREQVRPSAARRTVRAVGGAAIAALVALLLVRPGAAPADLEDRDASSYECPASARGVARSPDLGVRVFPQYAGSPYGQHAAVLDALGRLGVGRVSGLLVPDMPADQVAFYRTAHDCFGIRAWLAVGRPGEVLSEAQWRSVRDLLDGPLKGVVTVVSGWNEPNHRVDGDWVALTARHQRRLWETAQQVNAASGQEIRVGTPPLWSGDIDTQLDDLVALAPALQGSYDTINWHLYPHGRTGSDLRALLDRQLAEFTLAYGEHPVLNSESGYFTAPSYRGASNPSTEEEQAAQLEDLVALHRELGVSLSYFELLDDPDPSGTSREASFGLVRTPSSNPGTWSHKPAFATLRDLTQVPAGNG